MKIGGVCFFCIKKMWQTIAALLVITAVIISILKYSLPHIGLYRDDIQQWVQQEYGADIYIGNITAGWDGIGPAILLQNISLLPNKTTPLDLVIKEVRLKLDFFSSIREAHLTSDYFILDGVVATLDSSLLLQGSTANASENAPVLDALSQLLLGQLKEFSVTNSVINLNTPNNAERYLGIEQLTWRNDKDHHQGTGEFSIDGFAANSLSFVLDLNGSTRTDLSGQLYIEAVALDISPWLTQFASVGSKIELSNINFQSWTNIDDGVFGRAEISLGDNLISWSRINHPDKPEQQLEFGNGQMFWAPTPSGWEISSNDISLSESNGDWPTVKFNLKKQADVFDLYINQWSVGRTLNLLSLVELPAKAEAAFVDYNPEGLVNDFYAQFTNSTQWKLTGQLSGLGWNNVIDVPGLKNLAGHFGMTPQAGWLKLHGEDGKLLTGQLFKAPIQYQNVAVDLSLIKDHLGVWQLGAENLWLHDKTIDLLVEFSLALDDDPDIAIYGEISVPDLMVAENFYPPEYMGTNSIKYLNSAIKGGSIEVAQLMWSGSLAAFPYANNEGIFVVDAQIAGVDFLFTPGWPILSGIDGQLLFKNDSLKIVPHEGYFLGIDITDKAEALMPSISTGEVLVLDIHAVEELDKVAKLFRASPLRTIFNPVFDVLKVTDMVTAEAKLQIPLIGDGAYFDEHFDVLGHVAFKGNNLTIKTPGIELTEVNGVLNFHNNKLWTQGFVANWFGLPLSAQLNGQDSQGGFELSIDVDANVNTKPLFTAFDSPLDDYIKGDMMLAGKIDLVFPEQGMRYGVEVSTDLTKAALSFPQPYQKALAIPSTLSIRFKGDDISSLITANVDQQLFFNAILPHNQDTFSQAHLILGKRDLGLGANGFNISVDLPSVQVMPWYDLTHKLISHNDKSGNDSRSSMLMVPSLISGKVGEVSGFGQQLHGINFEVTEGNGSWDLMINAKETRTSAHFDRDWLGAGITVKTDYLRLPDNDEKEDEQEAASTSNMNSAALINGLPPIDFSCMDCQFGKYDLQRLDIEAFADGDILRFTRFDVVKGKHQLNATGEWVGDAGIGISAIKGRFSSDNIGRLLNEYDLTSSVRDSNASMDFFANWAGGPHQFNTPSLSGEVKWKMGEGHLTEISDRGSRLFSLLSFDSIIRKLKLDFRDVFSKGFFYNKMDGTMLIESGIAYTDNTKIDGVPADLVLKGSTNLVNNTLDYKLAFTPKYTSSLPTLIAFLVSPVGGIAALGLNEVFESKVISKIHFNLTGTVSEPVLTEIERKSRDIKLPQRTVTPNTPGKQQKPDPAVVPTIPDPAALPPVNNVDQGSKLQRNNEAQTSASG
ncbi:MAG: hypothetical protein ACI9FJ_000049 [Alteromonadaceae bacterium]|jgi:uncharacterized protein (TIGR02099 family)